MADKFDHKKATNIIFKSSVYTYIGIDKKNTKITGELTATSVAKARALLANQGINIIRLHKKKSFLFSQRRVKSVEITMLHHRTQFKDR